TDDTLLLVRELMFSSHLRSWEMMVPRKRNDSAVSTGGSLRGTGVGGAGFFLKSTTISTVFRAFSSRLFWPHQVTRWSISHLYVQSPILFVFIVCSTGYLEPAHFEGHTSLTNVDSMRADS